MQGKEKRILTINKPDGTTEEVEEVITFQFDDNKKRYVVYTKNEQDVDGNITIYVTEIIKDEAGYKFLGVENDEEWTRIKAALRTLIESDS